MAGQIVAVLFCLSPLLFLVAGYYIGRYGSPIVLKIQPPQDRRHLTPQRKIDESDDVEVYT